MTSKPHSELVETVRRALHYRPLEYQQMGQDAHAALTSLEEQLETAQRTLRKVKRKWPGTRPSWLTEAVASTPASEPKENA